MKKKMMLIASVCFWSAYANGPIDEMIKAMKEQMIKKDETIATLTTALAKTEHKQVKLTAGGEVMQLVSEADFKELAARVAACEKTNADQDAKLGMTMDTRSKVRKEIKDGRVGAPPAPPPSPQPPLPSLRPIAKPGRRLSSSSNGNFVNELSITGSNAVVSWNSHTPGLMSFNCTGIGDGKLTCSGQIHASDVVTASGTSLDGVANYLNSLDVNWRAPCAVNLSFALAANFDFEEGVSGTGFTVYSHSVPGWDAEGSVNGLVNNVYTGHASWGAVQATSGSYYEVLQRAATRITSAAFSPWSGGCAVCSDDFTGTAFRLRFDTMPRPGYSEPSLTVRVNGHQVIQMIDMTSPAWTTHELNISSDKVRASARGAKQACAFVIELENSPTSTGDRSVFLDNVRVDQLYTGNA